MVRKRSTASSGFTLIELMMVISIILILVSIATPIYKTSILHAREAVLYDDLFNLRNTIQQYTLDKQRAPQSLQDLVTANYIKQIPKDPITGSTETWTVEEEDTLLSVDQSQPGIIDVHSGSTQVSSEGTAYNTW